MLLLFAAAVLPGLWWEGGAQSAAELKRAGIRRVYVPAASAWKGDRIEVVSLDQAARKQFLAVPKPGVRFEMNVASATRVPWVDANGWRFERGLAKANYDDLPAGSATLAAAEAYAYGVEAILSAAPADLEALGGMQRFLEQIERPRLPGMANIGVIEDGSTALGEVLNLLGRRNLLYRVIKEPDSSLDLNIRLGSKEFPLADARNPSQFAAKIRERLGDEQRLLRLYGSPVVIARLTGDATRARLHLLNYGSNGARDVRLRLRGDWTKGWLASFGAPGAQLADWQAESGAVEFTVPELGVYAVVDLEKDAPLRSRYAAADFPLTADPESEPWAQTPGVIADRTYLGAPLAGTPTEIRSRWTNKHLYLLFVCPYTELNLRPDPSVTTETPRLWDWDVAEAFIGADFDHIGRYKEFQVSPQGEWIDLDIDRDHAGTQGGAAWNSGYTVKARIDAERKVWYGEMRIPLEKIGVAAPRKGMELRIGLYRIAGRAPERTYVAWRPTGQKSFHVPGAFGRLRFD